MALPHTVFYSWQSDRTPTLGPKTNRNFVLDALGRASKKLGRDELGLVEVDRDTSGVSGTPDIASTILKKIDAADGFVADVTIINADTAGNEGRLTPNPNVLLELGYALRELGPERVVLVMNTAGGDIHQLPFDLRGRRVLPYQLSLDADPDTKREVREGLVTSLYVALRSLLELGPRSNGAAEGHQTRLQSAAEGLEPWMNESLERFQWAVAPEPFGDGRKEIDDDRRPVQPALYRHGLQETAYAVVARGPLDIRAGRLLEALMQAEVNYTGWPIWAVMHEAADSSIRPRPLDSGMERLIHKPNEDDPFVGDFWRADSAGRSYIVRGYKEDRDDRAGTIVDIDQPIRNVSEALAHASRYAAALDHPDADIAFRIRFGGLDGRRLGAINRFRDTPYNRHIHQDSFERSLTTSVSEIESDLPVLVFSLLAPFYELFNFYSLAPQRVESTIEKHFSRVW